MAISFLKDNLDLYFLHLYFTKRRGVINSEKLVLISRYGLNNEKERTQKEIAKELKISRSYVSRIEKRALMKVFHEYYHQEKR